jgi:hypothetical protein
MGIFYIYKKLMLNKTIKTNRSNRIILNWKVLQQTMFIVQYQLLVNLEKTP